jgi:hypothetical protein
MTITAIAPAARLPYQREWTDLTEQQRSHIEDVIDGLDPEYGLQGTDERTLLALYIAKVAGITLTPGHEAVQCDTSFGCSAILDAFHAQGIATGGDQLVFCTTCMPDAANRFDA